MRRCPDSLQRLRIDCVRRCVWPLVLIPALLTVAHEGHQPLPTNGVQLDLKTGHLTLSRVAREMLDVTSVAVESRGVTEVVPAYATVVTPWDRKAYVTSRLPGRIVKLLSRPGDAVEAGQVLAELESLDLHTLRLDYQAAENEFELSAQLLESLKPAVEAGSLPTQRLVEAENTFRQNQNSLDVLRAKAAALQVAAADLHMPSQGDLPPLRLLLKSRIHGVVVHADIVQGKFVEPTEHLFEIVDTSRVWVKIGVLERDLHRVREGQAIRVSFNGLPDTSFDTSVDKLGMWLDPRTHQGTAWAEIVNCDNRPRVLPGMSGQAELALPGRHQGLTVPVASLFSDGAERYVFVEEAATRESSEYRKKPVVIGRRTHAVAELIAGDIYPGDRVVTRGGHELSSLFFLGVLRISPETATAIGLKVEAASARSVEQILKLDGVVEVPPQRRTSVSSQLTGTLHTIQVDRGQSVKEGDILAEIASLELQDVQLDLLKAHLDGAMWRDTFARLRNAGEAVPRRSLLEMESRVRALESRFANLRQKLLTLGLSPEQIEQVVKTKRVVAAFPVRASISGVIVDFNRVLGQVVRSDEPLFEIHDLSQMWVQAFVSERDSAHVHIGQTARIRLVAFPELEALGTVARLGPVLGAESRIQAAWIEFQNPPSVALQHNMLARVSLTADRPPPTLAVPVNAAFRDGLRSFLFVQKADNTFERRRVAFGRADDRFVEVEAGLKPGEAVAIGGVPQLQAAFSAVR